MFDNEPETPKQQREWKEAVHKAIYRSFIGAASLSSVYMEPIHDIHLGPTLDPEKPRYCAVASAQRCAAYQTKLDPQQDHNVFGGFGQWLLQDILSDTASRSAMEETFRLNRGRAYGCSERSQFEPADYDYDDEMFQAKRGCPLQADDLLSHADRHLLALELVRLLWACGQMAEQRPFRGHAPARVMSTCGPVFLWDAFAPLLIAFEEPPPVSTEEASTPPLLYLQEPHQAQLSEDRGGMFPQALLQIADQYNDWLSDLARQSIFMPPTKYKFFVYFLHRHLQAAFEPDFFEPESGQMAGNNFNAFLRNMRIFARDDSKGAISYYPDSLGNFEWAEFLDGVDVLLPWGPLQDRVFLEM